MFRFPNKERQLNWVGKFVTTYTAETPTAETPTAETATELSELNSGAETNDTPENATEAENQANTFPRERFESRDSNISLDGSLMVCRYGADNPQRQPISGGDKVADDDACIGALEEQLVNDGDRAEGEHMKLGEDSVATDHAGESGSVRQNESQGDLSVGGSVGIGLVLGGVLLAGVGLAEGGDDDNEQEEWFDGEDEEKAQFGVIHPSEYLDESDSDNGQVNKAVGVPTSIDEGLPVNEMARQDSDGVEGECGRGEQGERPGKSKIKRSGGEGGRWEAQNGGGWKGEKIRDRARQNAEDGDDGDGTAKITPAGGLRKRSRIPVYVGRRNGRVDGRVAQENAEAERHVGQEENDGSGDDDLQDVEVRVPVVIDMRAYERINSRPSEYLKEYFNWMYRFGIAAYQPLEKGGVTTWFWNNFWSVIHFLQKLLCAIILTTSALKSLCQAKGSYLQFIAGDEQSRYNSFVGMAYNLCWFFTKMFADYLFVIVKERVERMLKSMQEYETACYTEASSLKSKWKRILVALMAIATMAVVILRTFFESSGNGFKGLVLSSSQELAEDIFIWSSVDMSKVAEGLEPEYSNELNVKSGIMGGFVLFRDGTSYLQLGMMFDLVIVVGIVLLFYTLSFVKDVKDVTPNVPRENIEEWNQLHARREAVWWKYRLLRDVFDDANEVFDPLLKLMHVANLLFYSFFMVMLIFQNATWYGLLLYVINLVKVEFGYLIDTKIAEVNEIIRDWIRNWAVNSGKFKVGDDEMDASLVMDELDKKPLGLGKGKFVIHQNFHIKFLGLVLSVFFSMADEEKKDKETCKCIVANNTQ